MNKNDLLKYLHLKKSDITKESTNAIVNAANTSLLGGGGVDGAIHRAAGPGLLEECRNFGGCNPGEARITKGYNLQTKYVIHTPGPVYKDGKSGEEKILTASYNNSMLLAKDNNLKSISFSAISTGVYGYPREDACKVAVNTVLDFMIRENYPIDVYFVLFDNENKDIYEKYIIGLKNELY
jgi:O-acetyl-ADP-ribose deacetylase